MATTNYDTEGSCDSETNSKRGSETEGNDSAKTSSLKRGRGEKKVGERLCSPKSKKLKKMGSFQWSWSDECVILKNFYEFGGKNGSYSKDFYHFVKNKLSAEVSNSQLSDKVYRLRKRFLKEESEMEMGKLMKFSNANHKKLYEMSKNIWGSNSNAQKSQSKPEAVNYGFYDKLFKQDLENIKVDISCIPFDILEDIRKDWDEMKRAQNEYELKNAKLLLQIADIRCKQNKM